ncbi:MAG: hypothetical protein ACE5ES_03795 [Candidatus Nanoarchaeia archaeon]
MDKIRYLDLDSVELFGWETDKSDLLVDAICRGIELGDEFPPVPVHEIEGKYYLSMIRDDPIGRSDGGHYRSVGHYIMKKPLKVEIVVLPKYDQGFPPLGWGHTETNMDRRYRDS